MSYLCGRFLTLRFAWFWGIALLCAKFVFVLFRARKSKTVSVARYKGVFRTFSSVKKVRFWASQLAKGKIVPFSGVKKYDLKVG